MASPPEAGCPVARALHVTLQAGDDFGRALHRLRQETRHCRLCPHAAGCQVRCEYNRAVLGAIRAVRRAWETPK